MRPREFYVSRSAMCAFLNGTGRAFLKKERASPEDIYVVLREVLPNEDKRWCSCGDAISETHCWICQMDGNNKWKSLAAEMLDAWGDYSPAPGNSKAYQVMVKAKKMLSGQ